MWMHSTAFLVLALLTGTGLNSFRAGHGAPLTGSSAEAPAREFAGQGSSWIDTLIPDAAPPGEIVTISGSGFGAAPGYVVLTGLRVDATDWSDTSIAFTVPNDGASDFVYIRDGQNEKSNRVAFTVERDLVAGQFAPDGLEIVDMGLPGPAFLVETDGEYLYAVSGFERLVTYRINYGTPYELVSCIYLPQRVGDLRIHGGYLYVSGDHGLLIFKCSDLQAGNGLATAAIAGASCMTSDAKDKAGDPVDGTLVAVCEYRPRGESGELRVPLYRFDAGELVRLGVFTRAMASNSEKQVGLAIDPLNPKVYVSGYEELLGNNKYLLELDVSDPANPRLNHREATTGVLHFDLDATRDRLWCGVSATGVIFFQSYLLQSGAAHLLPDETVKGIFGLGRTTRIKIVDQGTTLGAAWSGARPDLMLLSTSDNGPAFRDDASTVDWAFDITGFSRQTVGSDGKVFVADEWGGFLTYNYERLPDFLLGQEPEHQVMAAAMTEGLHLAGDRIYIAGRGAGPWSADRFDLADESRWRRVEWDWSAPEPQPHPVSAVCTRVDPEQGMLIAGLVHDKAMAWGARTMGALYRETPGAIELLALTAEIDPPGLFGAGRDIVWPEPDLVFMTTGADGFRGMITDPDTLDPRISIHNDCVNNGFGSDFYSTTNDALCMRYFSSDGVHRIVVGSQVGIFSGLPGLTLFRVEYPDGVPDRDFPDRRIDVMRETDLHCMRSKTAWRLEMTSSGLVAVATNLGVALFHISWIPALNAMGDSAAWNLIKLPQSAYSPWWESSWPQSFDDVSFKDESTIYCVQQPTGLWQLDVSLDGENYTHECVASAYYPGVECGIDYNNLLPGWGNPDIPPLHHPYGVVSDGESAYVTGWSGKVYRVDESW